MIPRHPGRRVKAFLGEAGVTGAEKALLACFALALVASVGHLVSRGSRAAASDAARALRERGDATGSLGAVRPLGAAGAVGSSGEVAPAGLVRFSRDFQEEAGGTVTVRPGDTLSAIAARELGDASRWPEIYALNRDVIGGDPGLIEVGMKLRLPGGPSSPPPPPPEPPGPPPGGELVSLGELRRIMPNLPEAKARAYLPHLNAAMQEFGITTNARKAAFLAQLAHESVELRYFEEIASGDAYEGRRDLGNTQPGDGRRYKGRGPIQLTGRANYRAAGAALGLDLEGNPQLAASPEVGFRIAGWYWKQRGLNGLADQGNFREITRRINGGYNGWSSRVHYHNRAKQVFP